MPVSDDDQPRSKWPPTQRYTFPLVLRKRGMEGDVDFLLEALQMLVESIIACPVPRHGGR
ncbi:MAG: hypothetical protein OXE87_04210 [Chloroflexi bacterium]|nr:hypothetical protein [Chloroflexota bacterium]